MRRLRWAALPVGLLTALVGSLLFAAGSGASLPQSGNVVRSDAVFSTRGQITKLAASGNLVAALTTHVQGSNDQIVVWWAPGSKAPRLVTHVNSANPSAVFESVSELALGGGRVAWIEVGGGNTAEDVVYSAPVGGGPARMLDYAAHGADDPGGDWAASLFGQGPLLYYNRWHVCTYMEQTPPHDCPVYGKVSGEKLRRISGSAAVTVRTGPSAFRLAVVGGGRLALTAASGVVTMASASGAPVATVPAVTGDPPRVVAVSATHLLVERAHTIDSYNPATGAHVGTIPLGSASLQLAGVNTRLALLRGVHRLVLVRLSDGKRVTFPLSSAALACACPVDAKLNETGLFYAYNVAANASKGRIVFEPTAALLSRF